MMGSKLHHVKLMQPHPNTERKGPALLTAMFIDLSKTSTEIQAICVSFPSHNHMYIYRQLNRCCDRVCQIAPVALGKRSS
jgi:hypothetical protein